MPRAVRPGVRKWEVSWPCCRLIACTVKGMSRPGLFVEDIHLVGVHVHACLMCGTKAVVRSPKSSFKASMFINWIFLIHDVSLIIHPYTHNKHILVNKKRLFYTERHAVFSLHRLHHPITFTKDVSAENHADPGFRADDQPRSFRRPRGTRHKQQECTA